MSQAGAKMAMAGAPASPRTVPLKQQLRRAERTRRLRAFGLVAPLFFFLIVSFVLPILGLLRHSIENPELPGAMPQLTAALRAWDGAGIPDDSLFVVLAQDFKAAAAAERLPPVAKRLNYEVTGYRSLVFKTARSLPDPLPADAKGALIEIDARWGERETWAALRRAAEPLTAIYLLAAVDHHLDADGRIMASPADEAIYVGIYLRTFWISAAVTLFCLALGFPIAYLLANLPTRTSNLLMILVLLPFWTSLLVRTAAWIILLQNQGLVNKAMIALGLVDQPVQLIFNRFGVVVAMTHVLLPFMVLPLYSVMKTIPALHMRAAQSLGAPPWLAFVRVYLPQATAGIAAGCLLVFMLALGYYITPALVGGAGDQMISWFIAFYTNQTINWGLSAALAAVLLTATMILYAVYCRILGTDRMRLG